MKKFRLIDTSYNNSYFNMAVDEILLTSNLPVLRFYGWKPAGLSIGYFQSVNDFNFKNLKKNKIDLVRRLTGGNAVLHDNELTYSFIIGEAELSMLRIDSKINCKSVIDSYKLISKGLLYGLKNIGLKAIINKEVEKGKKSTLCFNEPSWYEILVNGKKIIGSAQKRINGKLLQHGAILIDIDVKKYCSLIKKSQSNFDEVKKRITSINDELKMKDWKNKNIDYDAVREAMKKGFREALDIEFIESNLTKEELNLAKKLEKTKYSTKKWNLNFRKL